MTYLPRLLSPLSLATLAIPLVLWSLPAAATEKKAFEDDSRLFYETVQGTVGIEVFREEECGVGAGFYITPHLLMTCNHVVEKTRTCKVYRHSDTSSVLDGRVVYRDTLRDLAIVYTDSTSMPLALRWDYPSTGEAVYAIGAPHGCLGSFSAGVVSHYHPDAERQREVIQCTAEAAGGSSGGPLLDREGLVVGMVSERDQPAGYTYGVAAATLRSSLDYFRANYPFCAVDTLDAESIRAFLGGEFPELDTGEFAAMWPSEDPERSEDFWHLVRVGVTVTALLCALGGVLVRRHRRLRRAAHRKMVRAELEEIRSKAFLPDQLIEAELGTA